MKKETGKPNKEEKKTFRLCPSCNGGKKKRINSQTGKIIPCTTCGGKEII